MYGYENTPVNNSEPDHLIYYQFTYRYTLAIEIIYVFVC